MRFNSAPGVKRRHLLGSSLGLAVGSLAAPGRAPAQQAGTLRRVGWLSPTTGLRPAFLDAMRGFGWSEGKNIAYEVRAVDGRRERLAGAAAELAAAKVDLIVAVAPSAIGAARQATRDIPIVMAWWGGPDLVEAGIVASYARPGGNVTGVDMLLRLLDAKRLDILHEAVPRARKIAVLVYDMKRYEPQLPPVRKVAATRALELEVQDAMQASRDYDGAFEAFAAAKAQALLVMWGPDVGRDWKTIVELANRWRLPAIYDKAEHAREGGLLSYGTHFSEMDRQAASYVDKILRGAEPGMLPVEQPTRYELVVNQTTARALGITVPRTLLLRADETIG